MGVRLWVGVVCAPVGGVGVHLWVGVGVSIDVRMFYIGY